MDELLTLSTAELAQRIKAGQVSPVTVVEAHIRRIEEVNPKLNAVITPMFEQARAEAQAAAQRIAENGTEGLPPLFGVPVTIKDALPVAGVRFTAGSWYMRDHVAEVDAAVVRKLREAGAIILGKTNLPDMSWSPEAINPIFGRTLNPRHKAYTPGGSSGGESAIIAAGGSPLGIGSDIAGSVRIPAAQTGIVALKPTASRISTEGHVPQGASPKLEGWNTVGPMARRVEDLALALAILSETPVQDYRAVSLAGRRLTVVTNNPLVPVHREVSETVMLAAGGLTCADMELHRANNLPFTEVGLAYGAMIYREYGHAQRAALGGGQPYKLMEEIRYIREGQPHITPSILFLNEMTMFFGRVMATVGFASEKRLAKARQRILDAMTPGGVMLIPNTSYLPPQHGWTWWYLFRPPFTMLFNALGFPAVSIPIQYQKNGMPLSVQVVAQPGEDEVALAVAAELERVFGGWKIATP
ncbi:MAG: hypothetical protein OHK0046_03940 [Anaerolineae bacterium]